jgi:putative tryptophan/tyrosine transport system substrate-binding protein
MRRREFIAGLGSAAAWQVAARAQKANSRPLLAFLAVGKRETVPLLPPFQQGMRSLGYAEGVNIDIAYRFGDNDYDRLPVLAEEIVRLKPAVILAAAVVDAVAMRHATVTIPIVTPALADPINLGLVASIAHPGGNVTGIMPYVDRLGS